MKMDSETNNEIFDLCVSSEKARTVAGDLGEMIDDITVSNLASFKDRILTYADIAFDYIYQIDERLNYLCEKAELIEKGEDKDEISKLTC